MGTVKATKTSVRLDWSALWVAGLSIAVGGLLGGAAIGGTVWSLTATPERQPVGNQSLVAFGDKDEPGEYYTPVRIRRGSAIPARTMCLPPARPNDRFLRCFEPTGLSADQTLSEADADAVAEATAERLRQDIGDSVQRNEVTFNNFNNGDEDNDDDDNGWWSWTAVAGMVAIIMMVFGFWTGREDIKALYERLRPSASTRSSSGGDTNPDADAAISSVDEERQRLGGGVGGDGPRSGAE